MSILRRCATSRIRLSVQIAGASRHSTALCGATTASLLRSRKACSRPIEHGASGSGSSRVRVVLLQSTLEKISGRLCKEGHHVNSACVRRHHEHHHTRGGGYLYQGRFKSFPVEEDDYFLTLCRYVEANASRAGVVDRAEDWHYSGLWRRIHGQDGEDLPFLSPWPVERPRNWTARVNAGLADEQLETLRECVDRGRPYGGERWVVATAERLGLDLTLRGPGRPRKEGNNLPLAARARTHASRTGPASKGK